MTCVVKGGLEAVSRRRRDSSSSHELVGGLRSKFEAIRAKRGLAVSTRSERPQNQKENHPRPRLIPTSRIDGVKAPQHFKTPRSDRLLELELRIRDLHRVLGDGLSIFAAGVAPPDVLVRRLVHVPARDVWYVCVCVYMYVYMLVCI